MDDKAKKGNFGSIRKSAATPSVISPATHLDRLLNDLQGNGPLMFEDEGLARFGQARLRRIRGDALAQAAAALGAAAALRQCACEWAGTGWPGSPAARLLREHIVQLRQDARRWRHLAEYAARYLAHPGLAGLHARSWLAEAAAKGECPAGEVKIDERFAGLKQAGGAGSTRRQRPVD